MVEGNKVLDYYIFTIESLLLLGVIERREITGNVYRVVVTLRRLIRKKTINQNQELD